MFVIFQNIWENNRLKNWLFEEYLLIIEINIYKNNKYKSFLKY